MWIRVEFSSTSTPTHLNTCELIYLCLFFSSFFLQDFTGIRARAQTTDCSDSVATCQLSLVASRHVVYGYSGAMRRPTVVHLSTSSTKIIKQNDPRVSHYLIRGLLQCSGEVVAVCGAQQRASHSRQLSSMADANKRINLAAPLLSIRRHGGGGAETAATGLPPAYKADATSEPPGHHTSAVPFGWEHRPGHPKSVRTRRPPPPPAPPPPLTIVNDVDEPSRVTRSPAAVGVASDSVRARRGEERRSDALSRDDVSCVTVNCSATGISDAAGTGAGSGSGPCARRSGSVMMDRFLPAAHAVAAGSPQSTFRKAASGRAAVVLGARTAAGGDNRVPAQRRVPLQHIAAYHLPPLPPSGKNNDDDDDDDNSDAHSTAGFASKRCGLLSTPCVMSALLLSRVARRGAGTPFQSDGGGSRRQRNPLLPRSRNGQQQQQLQHPGDDHGMVLLSCASTSLPC